MGLFGQSDGVRAGHCGSASNSGGIALIASCRFTGRPPRRVPAVNVPRARARAGAGRELWGTASGRSARPPPGPAPGRRVTGFPGQAQPSDGSARGAGTSGCGSAEGCPAVTAAGSTAAALGASAEGISGGLGMPKMSSSRDRCTGLDRSQPARARASGAVSSPDWYAPAALQTSQRRVAPCCLSRRSVARPPGWVWASTQNPPRSIWTWVSRAPRPSAWSVSRCASRRSGVVCPTCRQFVLALDVPGLALPQVRRHGSRDGASLANSRNSVRNPLQCPVILSLLRDSRSRGDPWYWRWSGSAALDPTPDLGRSVRPRR